jgi:hypothetical protein
MRLTKESANKIARAAMSLSPGEIDCDDCAAKLELLAERILEARDIPEALKLVEEHLERCPECKEEFEEFLAGLRELDQIKGSQ